MQSVIRTAITLAYHNRPAVERSTVCGCYYCGHTYPAKEVVEYTDGGLSALCPRCKVDAVLSDSQQVEITAENLKLINKYWFRTH